MFQTLKRFFKKKQENNQVITDDVIKFKDAHGQESEIRIEPDGNGNILAIVENKNDYKLAFDRESALLLANILICYNKNGNLDNILTIFEKSEE